MNVCLISYPHAFHWTLTASTRVSYTSLFHNNFIYTQTYVFEKKTKKNNKKTLGKLMLFIFGGSGGFLFLPLKVHF